MISRLLCGAILLVGLAGLTLSRNLIKKVAAISVMNSAVILLFILSGAETGVSAPILTGLQLSVVDPLPQALMLTAIVVGVAVMALALVLSVRLFERFGTLDSREIEARLRDET
ncbi:MAG TPA: cation:proton antiporter subunit C [Magnetospirillaceae bacterium]|nr:cation:proton antiporter subunit C [Magnetospirillaceae bacterium]